MAVDSEAPPPEEDATSWRQIERDYYVLLGVERDASSSEIRNRFLSLSREFHPDRRRQGHAEIVAAANAQYAVLDRAYKVLIDPIKRHVYDMYGEKGIQVLEQDHIASQNMVGFHLQTRDEVQQYMEKLVRQRHEQALDVQFVSHSELAMHVDASDWVHAPMQAFRHLLDPHVHYMARTQMTLHQRTDFPLSRTTKLSIGGFMYDRLGLTMGGFTTALSYKSLSPSLPSVTLSSQLGSVPKLHCQLSQPVSRYTVFMLIPELDEHGLDLSVGVNQLLAPQLHGSMMWSTRDGLSGSLGHDTDTQTATAAVAVNAAGPNLSLQVRRAITSAATIKLSLRASMMAGVSIVTGMSRELSHRTRVAVGVLLARAGVTLRLGFTRGSVRFVVPIFLSPFSAQSTSFAFCAAASPFVVAAIVSQLLKPAQARQRRRAAHARLAMQRHYLATASQSAQEQQQLMARWAEENLKHEQERPDGKGLIILLGRYGQHPTNPDSCDARGEHVDHMLDTSRFTDREGDRDEYSAREEATTEGFKPACIDVTIPLRFFVKNGTLALTSASKAKLLGFYNPCVDTLHTIADAHSSCPASVKPLLYVRYVYGGQVFEATFDDEQAVSLPSKYAQLMGPVGRVH